MRINTGIKATDKVNSILNSVLGQLSDGIWGNILSMEKYWKSLDFTTDSAGYLVIDDKYSVCDNPQDFFANKIKRIIEIEIDDGNNHLAWDRACDTIPSYIHGGVTVGDCYELYGLLKSKAV